MSNKLVKIYSKKIYGVANQVLIVEGKTEELNYDFTVYADDEVIPFEIDKEDSNFTLTINLEKRQKHIVISFIHDKKEKVICKINNYMISRLFNKISNVINRTLRKIGVVFKTLYKGIKFIWKE